MEEASATILRCPRCSAGNPPQRKYCAKCGASLWENCFLCGQTCAAGEEFCGACGANVHQAAAENLARAEAALRDAERLRADCRFDEAIVTLSSVRKNKHPRVADHASQAAELIKLLSAERSKCRHEAAESLRKAQDLFAECDYDGAWQVIEAVPASLKNGQFETLVGQISQRREELEALTADLRSAAKQKRLEDILPTVERLLAIKPDHAQAKSLAEQVQKRLVAAADAELAAHRYDRAVQLLDQVPSNVLTPRGKELDRRARELAALSWNLRNSPLVDRTLIALGDRLRRLAPKDASIAKLHETLRQRGSLLEQRPGRRQISWAKPPQSTPLGAPVDWLTDFRRIKIATPEPSDMDRHPGRFAVATGLALAGLGQAAVEIDLLASGQLTVMNRMAKLIRPKNTRVAWGIDVGASGLKAVKLAWDATKREAAFEEAVLAEHAKPLHHAANEIEENKLVVETLRTFLDKRQCKGERICAGLPARMSLCRQFDLPPANSRQARKLVEFEARVQLNFPLDQLVWDYHVLDRAVSAQTAEAGGGQTLLIAAKQHAVERFIEAFRQAGMCIDMLQPDFIAMHNLLVHDCLASAGNKDNSKNNSNGAAGPLCSTAVGLDIGCHSTNIIVSSPRSFWFHGCGIAGDGVTRALVKEFKLSSAQAEQLKRSVESAASFSAVEQVLTPTFDDLLGEIQRLLAGYSTATPDRPFQRVLCCGGGFALHGLFRHLRCGR